MRSRCPPRSVGPVGYVRVMRNAWNAIVNWIAALFASSAGAPHPIVATDDVGTADGSSPER